MKTLTFLCVRAGYMVIYNELDRSIDTHFSLAGGNNQCDTMTLVCLYQ